jgi:hypothetical protein
VRTARRYSALRLWKPMRCSSLEPIFDQCVYLAHIDHAVYNVHLTETAASTSPSHMVTNTDPDYESLCPYFGWLPFDTVKETFACTTQYACMPMSMYLKHRFNSPYPALNVHHHNKPVATDTVYSARFVFIVIIIDFFWINILISVSTKHEPMEVHYTRLDWPIVVIYK